LSASKEPGPTVFVRESTGLIKNVSFFDAIFLNMSTQSAGTALAVITLTMILLPSVAGVNLVYASIIAFVIVIPQLIVYTMLSRRMPRTGGDYIWTSRILGGFAGSTLAFMGYTTQSMAFEALICLSTILAIGSVGVALGNASFMGLALPGNMGGDPTSQFAVGALIIIILIAINVVKPKYGYKIVSACMLIGVLSLIVANSVLLAGGTIGVENYINSLGIHGVTYQSVASSYSGSTFDFGATMSVIPYFAMLVYPWFGAPAVGSELKTRKAMNWNVPLSAIISLILVTSSFANLYYVGGFEFITAASSNPTLVFNYGFNFWTLAMGVANNFGISLFIGLGWVLWNVAVLAFGVIVIARYIFAQAFDRFLPAAFAYVSPKYGSPIMAQLTTLVVTLALVAGVSFYYGTLTSLFGTTVAPMVYFMFVGISAVIYAFRNETGSTKAILTIAGILSAFVFLYLAYEFLANPGIWGGNSLAYGFVVTSAVAGAAIYLTSKYYHSKHGLDITLAYKQIPPE
jgi:amino acid transporter